MTNVRISDLKHRVRLERASRTGDGGGGGDETWSLIAEFWAGVIPVQGREPFRSEQVQGERIHHVVCRFREDVLLRDRLVLGARHFNIRGILDFDDEAQFLKLICEEQIA